MLTKLKLALAIAAPLVAGATTYAVAQGTGGQGNDARKAEMIQKFDQNGDGVLDDAERAQMKAAFQEKRAEKRAARLAKYDTNKDGKLEKTERVAMRDDIATTKFQKLDTNRDGQLSLDEYKAGAKLGHHRHGRRFHGGMRGGPGGQGGQGSSVQ